MPTEKDTRSNFVFIRRTDGSVIDIPRDHLEDTLRRHKDWKILQDEEPKSVVVETPKEESVIPKSFSSGNTYTCPICEKQFKNQGALNLHKRWHK